jgi:uncharacterized BrkB/YihY/UPF0761 family membrane protein
VKEITKMRIATLISTIITGILMLSTMICGLWIKSNNITDASSLEFHIICGIASVIFCFISITLLVVLLNRMKKGDAK